MNIAYEQGKKAYKNGLSFNENWYIWNTTEYYDWNKGWLDKQAETNNLNNKLDKTLTTVFLIVGSVAAGVIGYVIYNRFV